MLGTLKTSHNLVSRWSLNSRAFYNVEILDRQRQNQTVNVNNVTLNKYYFFQPRSSVPDTSQPRSPE